MFVSLLAHCFLQSVDCIYAQPNPYDAAFAKEWEAMMEPVTKGVDGYFSDTAKCLSNSTGAFLANLLATVDPLVRFFFS